MYAVSCIPSFDATAMWINRYATVHLETFISHGVYFNRGVVSAGWRLPPSISKSHAIAPRKAEQARNSRAIA